MSVFTHYFYFFLKNFMGDIIICSKIAFLGPQGTFTHEAASLVSDNLVSYCSIHSVMDSVKNGQCSKGIVPIENSIEGQVGLTLDELVHNFDLMIEGEIIIPINHNLLVKPGCDVSKISDVFSHSQALAQCHKFLEKNGFKSHFTLSTAAAAKSLSDLENAGAIGTLKAAELYGLEVARKSIQDIKNNQTRFIVLSKEDHLPTGRDKTSIAFSLFDDKPGGLYSILELFAQDNVNLSKIESRPSKEGLGNYIFFIDIYGHKSDDKIRTILINLKEKTSFMKILGSYPIYTLK